MQKIAHAFLICAMFLPCAALFAQSLPPREVIPGTDSTLKIAVPNNANGGNSVFVPDPIPVPSASDLAVKCYVSGGAWGAAANPAASCSYSNALGPDPGPFSWRGNYLVTYKGAPLGSDWVISWGNCSAGSTSPSCAGAVKTISGADLYNPNSPNRADSANVTVKYVPTNTTYAPLTYAARVSSVGSFPSSSDFTMACNVVPNFKGSSLTSSFTPWTAKCGSGGAITGGTASWHAVYNAYYRGAPLDPNKFTITWLGGCSPSGSSCIGKTIAIADTSNASSAGRTDNATIRAYFRLASGSPTYQMAANASVTATASAPKIVPGTLSMQGCTFSGLTAFTAPGMCGYAPTYGSFTGTLTYNGVRVALSVPCPQQYNPLTDGCSGSQTVVVGGKSFTVEMWANGGFKRDGNNGASAGLLLNGTPYTNSCWSSSTNPVYACN